MVQNLTSTIFSALKLSFFPGKTRRIKLFSPQLAATLCECSEKGGGQLRWCSLYLNSTFYGYIFSFHVHNRQHMTHTRQIQIQYGTLQSEKTITKDKDAQGWGGLQHSWFVIGTI